ncbi:protein REVEILLE 6 isoform X1 [Selaginella moellendorffii]|uniref:protein REVEILLE 6 isoform X1 n=1 Tax=Selaginella moellendorffii TaxID=88036 RepID=UPI000D1C5AB5|nr:protein REVEILLE 6 isoform X1 [Selaginella moellendorffii]|eukprot:XP_024514769.1 protein REVEILLE 6 isoform X1 [Selaginella moellendorffii]
MNAEMVGLMANPALPSDDAVSKKIRKPYTITKSRESWTEQEHDKFLEALQLFDRDWKKIEAFVGSKTVIQIRSHAQKYFLKVQKNGTGEHVPPPRPKRKSAQPYPQKAAKPAPPQRGTPHPPPPDFAYMVPQCNMFVPGVTASPVSSWVHHGGPQGTIPFYKDPHQPELATPANIKNQNNSSTANTWAQDPPAQANPQRGRKTGEKVDRANGIVTLSAAPAFSEVYKFIGSIFDPGTAGHLKKLREMAPIDRETVLLLMRNLAINLSSPDFDQRKLFVSVYETKENGMDFDDFQQGGDEETARNVEKSSQEALATAPPLFPGSQPEASIPQAVADVSKHQRHPYDGGGGLEEDRSGLDPLYNIAEALEDFDPVDQVEKIDPESIISDGETLKMAAAAAAASRDDDDQSVEGWWP